MPMDGAKVMVVIFSDYQCPHCRAAHEAYKGLMRSTPATGQVRFVLKHFPLEGECNSYAPNGGHMRRAKQRPPSWRRGRPGRRRA